MTGPADDVEADFDDDDGVPFEGTVLLEGGTFSSFTEDFSSWFQKIYIKMILSKHYHI